MSCSDVEAGRCIGRELWHDLERSLTAVNDMAYVELAYIHNFNLGRKSKSIRNAQIAQIRTHAARVTRSRAKVTKADTFADCHDVTGGTDHRTGEDAEQLVPQGVFFHAGLGPTNGDFFNVLSTGDHENVRQAIAGCT